VAGDKASAAMRDADAAYNKAKAEYDAAMKATPQNLTAATLA